MDLLSLNFTSLRCFSRVQDTSEPRICFELPSAQELRSTVDIVFFVALASSTFPATDSFPAVSLTALGSSKRIGILGEKCVPLVEKHGKD